MASANGAVASGADFDAQATRRRNVPSTSPNGGLVNRVEIDEKKTQVKQVSSYLRAVGETLFLGAAGNRADRIIEPTICPGISRRVGVYHCTSDLHIPRLLHKTIQDRFITHCDLG
jgi:hypothetical protein